MAAVSTPPAAAPAPGPSDLAIGAVIAVAYAVAVLLGLRWAVLPGVGSSVWPAAGIAFAGLLLGGSRLWPAIVVGRLGAAIWVGTPLPLWADLGVAVATMLGAWLPVRLIETRRRPLERSLGSMRAILWLTLGGGLGGAIVSATLGAAVLGLAGTPADALPFAWLNWWFGYFVGVLTLAPLILSWSAPEAWRLSPWQWGHLLVALACVAAPAAALFLNAESTFFRTWHLLPPLVWVALAFNVRGLSAAMCALSALAIAGAMRGTGPLATAGLDDLARVLLTQQYIAMNALTLLVLAAVAEERRDAHALGRLAAVVASAPEAMLSFDPDGRILSWNRAAEDLFGWTEAEALGRDHRLILPAGEGAAAGFHRALAGADVREETVRVARDGTAIPVLATKAPIRAPDGRILGVASVLRDIRARKAAEEALQRLAGDLERRVAERTAELEAALASLRDEVAAREAAEAALRQAQKMEAVGQLTGGLAHDFNNMLAVVTGSLDMARRRLGGADPRVAELLGHALEGATRAARLTARLLAFSRQQPLAPAPVDPNALVGGLVELLRRTLGERQTVETALAEGLPPVFTDPNGLENALLNLAVNARDAMPEGGTVRLATALRDVTPADARRRPGARPGPHVEFAVSDTGSGMAPEVAARAFEPFFTTKAAGKGTGLGLSQVYGFARQSGGHVVIDTAPGRGTTVRIALPRWDGDAAAAPGPAGPATPPAAPRGRILVVEDDPEVRRTTLGMLGELGHDAVEAASGEEALEMLARDPDVAILLTDVVMPGLDGRRLAEIARRARPGLRVLFATGYAPGDEAAAFGPDAVVLPKPFTLDELARHLAQVLGGRD